MPEIKIVHPSDTRESGPLTLIFRGRLSAYEQAMRAEELAKHERPYQIIGEDGKPSGDPVWRRPGAPSSPNDPRFWQEALEPVLTGWLNAPDAEDGKPATFTRQNFYLLFDDKYSIENYDIEVDSLNEETKMPEKKTITLPRTHFPMYAMNEWRKATATANPTPATSPSP